MKAKTTRVGGLVAATAMIGLIAGPHIARGQGTTLFISNGTWRVSASPDWGGAIVEIVNTAIGGQNWINNGLPDTGRSLQVSLYQAGQDYSNGWPCPNGSGWGWNAVQAGTMSYGDCRPVGSGVVSMSDDGSSISSLTQPLHWNPTLGRSNVLLNQTVHFLSGYTNVIELDYGVTNNESFTVSRTHEAPVVCVQYFVAPYKVTYQGSNPWTYDTVTTVGNGDARATEPWVAAASADPNVDSTQPAMGLYVADHFSCCQFTFGGDGTSGTTTMQSWRNLTIGSGGSASWTVYLIVGDFATVRRTIYSLAGH